MEQSQVSKRLLYRLVALISIILILAFLGCLAMVYYPFFTYMQDRKFFENHPQDFEKILLTAKQAECQGQDYCIERIDNYLDETTGWRDSSRVAICGLRREELRYISVGSPNGNNFVYIPSRDSTPVSVQLCGRNINCDIQLSEHWFLCYTISVD